MRSQCQVTEWVWEESVSKSEWACPPHFERELTTAFGVPSMVQIMTGSLCLSLSTQWIVKSPKRQFLVNCYFCSASHSVGHTELLIKKPLEEITPMLENMWKNLWMRKSCLKSICIWYFRYNCIRIRLV